MLGMLASRSRSGRMLFDFAVAASPLLTEGIFAAARTGKEGQIRKLRLQRSIRGLLFALENPDKPLAAGSANRPKQLDTRYSLLFLACKHTAMLVIC
jgi:hypothetical protein